MQVKSVVLQYKKKRYLDSLFKDIEDKKMTQKKFQPVISPEQ